MWEIKRRLKGETLWRGKDAEGRRIWVRTLNREDDTPQEPIGSIVFYSMKQAMKPGN